MSNEAQVIELFWSDADVARGLSDASDPAERLREGLPFVEMERIRDRLGITTDEMGELLGISPRTMVRRRRTGFLTADEFDRLYRVTRIATHAATVFGTLEKAATWLKTENRSLSGKVPLYLLRTDVGTQRVEDALHRIEFGIYA
jgi:putative toxin-antitoxin system antitoxin component (TIGR02293 family)